jgi:hypothetical protein
MVPWENTLTIRVQDAMVPWENTLTIRVQDELVLLENIPTTLLDQYQCRQVQGGQVPWENIPTIRQDHSRVVGCLLLQVIAATVRQDRQQFLQDAFGQPLPSATMKKGALPSGNEIASPPMLRSPMMKKGALPFGNEMDANQKRKRNHHQQQ